MRISWIFCVWFNLILTSLNAQQLLSIKESESKISIPFVNIIIYNAEGDSLVKTSNEQGHFVLEDGFKYIFARLSSIFYETGKVQPIDGIFLFKKRIKDLNPLVVTGQYGHTVANESIHPVKVITAERIQSQGAISLKDVLTNETNIRISQDGVFGSSMAMQGVGGENIKIMIDGVPVIGKLDGSIDLSQINMDNVERIEIVEGPLSVSYGTNALGGTINIITRPIQPKIFRINANTYYESVGQYNGNIKLQHSVGKHGFKIGAGRNFFDGWAPTDAYTLLPVETIADTTRAKDWDSKEQYFANLKYQFKTEKVKLIPYINWFDEIIENRGAPRLPYFETAFDDTYRTRRTDIGVNWQVSALKNFEIQGVTALNDYLREKNSYIKDLTNLEKQLTATPGSQDTTKFNLFLSRGTINTNKDSSTLNYQFGYDMNLEQMKGKRIENGLQTYGDFAVFGSAYLKLTDVLILKPALRVMYNTNYKTPWVPSLNFKFSKGVLTLRGSYAKGFRAPSLKELYFEFIDVNHNIVGNEDLLAETSDNFQTSLHYKKMYDKFSVQTSAKVYYNQISNRISLSQIINTTQFSYFNISDFNSQGFRIDGGLVTEKIKINANLALNGIRYTLGNEDILFDRYSYSPEISSNLTYRSKKYNLSASLFYKYNGQLNSFFLDANNSVVEGILDSYNTLDISLSKSILDGKLKLDLGVKNIFDVTNIASSMASSSAHSSNTGSAITAWGRTLFVALHCQFKKEMK